MQELGIRVQQPCVQWPLLFTLSVMAELAACWELDGTAGSTSIRRLVPELSGAALLGDWLVIVREFGDSYDKDFLCFAAGVRKS